MAWVLCRGLSLRRRDLFRLLFFHVALFAQPRAEPQPMNDATPMIALEKVEKRFGGFEVLKGIDLTVARGEKVVIAGPSGSGKSTVIRCVNRLERHDSGRIVVDGMELTDDPKQIEAIRREIGMVAQQFNLFPHLTVLENLILAPVKVRGMKRGEAESLAMHFLKRVHIPEQAQKYPS